MLAKQGCLQEARKSSMALSKGKMPMAFSAAIGNHRLVAAERISGLLLTLICPSEGATLKRNILKELKIKRQSLKYPPIQKKRKKPTQDLC
jgi:hypothetical protein